MGSEESKLPPAGWYDDPDARVGVKRYWDGVKWTDRFEGEAGPKPVDAIDRRFTSLYKIANILHTLGWVTIILGGLLVVIATIAAATSDQTTTVAFGEVRRTEPGANAAVIAIAGGIGVAVYALLLFAASALIRLALRAEDNTFRTAAAVERLVARGESEAGREPA